MADRPAVSPKPAWRDEEAAADDVGQEIAAGYVNAEINRREAGPGGATAVAGPGGTTWQITPAKVSESWDHQLGRRTSAAVTPAVCQRPLAASEAAALNRMADQMGLTVAVASEAGYSTAVIIGYYEGDHTPGGPSYRLYEQRLPATSQSEAMRLADDWAAGQSSGAKLEEGDSGEAVAYRYLRQLEGPLLTNITLNKALEKWEDCPRLDPDSDDYARLMEWIYGHPDRCKTDPAPAPGAEPW